MKKDDRGGAYSTYGRRGEVHIGFWVENMRERDPWKI
jgi:hypothetical protein